MAVLYVRVKKHWQVLLVTTALLVCCLNFHSLLTYRSKHIRAFVKVNHGKEELVGILLAIAIRIGNYLEFVVGLPKM